MAAAVLSAAASILEKKGLKIKEIKEILFSCCDLVEIETKPSVPLWSTNVEDYIAAELNRKNELVRVFNNDMFQELLRNMSI